MLEFLQTGKMLYVLAAVCALGTLSKLVTGSLYKRLIRETGNMALTKDKNLKALKQRMENTFLVNHGIRNASAYIEKQLYGFRFLHMTLDGWNHLSMQAMMLCFMGGGAAAFAAYWYRYDSYDIVMYGAAGIFGGLLLVFVDQGVDAASKRKQLADHLVDYVENSPHFYRNAENYVYSEQEKKKASGASEIVDFAGSAGNPESIRKERLNGRFSVLGRKKEEDPVLNKNSGRTNRPVLREPDQESKGKDLSGENNGKSSTGRLKRNGVQGTTPPRDKAGNQQKQDFREILPDEADLAQSIAHLSESLRQIAAGREQTAASEQEQKCMELIQNSVSAEDMKVLKTLLHAFQSSGS